MLCEFFSFLTCIVIVYREEETCAEQCAKDNRVLPSYAIVQRLSTQILNQSEAISTNVGFAIDVEFDFARNKWVDKISREMVMLPWRQNYPQMSDLLLVRMHDGKLAFTTMSSNHGTPWKKPFYCSNQPNTRHVPMTMVNAIKHCSRFNATIEIDTVVDETRSTTHWTGARRFNLTHFKRSHVIFEPPGLKGTWADFPSIAIIKIENKAMVAINALSDANDQSYRNDCFCFLDTMGSLIGLSHHEMFVIYCLMLLVTLAYWLVKRQSKERLSSQVN